MAHFIIAGGGIAGLCAALALGRLGHAIDIYERRPGDDDLGAGLQLSPNATSVIRSLGLIDRLEAIAVEPERLVIRRGVSGAAITTLPFGAAARHRYGAPFLLVQRGDFRRVLAAAVAELSNVAVTHRTSVSAIDADSGTATLSGPSRTTRIWADAVIRADGLHAGAGGAAPIYSGKTAWRALIPAERLPDLFAAPHSNLWLGPRLHAVHYPLRGGTVVNLVVIVDETVRRETVDPWAEHGDPDDLAMRLRGWHSSIADPIRQVTAWRKWPLFRQSAQTRWTEGRQTLIGDAAHPMLPFIAQGASQAVEDAAALAEAVTMWPAAIPEALERYETMRTARVRRVQEVSTRQGFIYHLGGPAASARDLAMKLLGPQRLLASMDWLYRPQA